MVGTAALEDKLLSSHLSLDVTSCQTLTLGMSQRQPQDTGLLTYAVMAFESPFPASGKYALQLLPRRETVE